MQLLLRWCLVLYYLYSCTHISCVLAVLPNVAVDPASHLFVDANGQIVIFHGINAVQKPIPYDVSVMLTPSRIKDLQDWGFNMVRAGMMWEGLEPVRGQYNASYLANYVKTVQALADAGIYTLVDDHQDVYSAHYCGGGFPMWASQPDPTSWPFPLPIGEIMPRNPQGVPTQCGEYFWANYYFTDEVGTTFQNLYSNAGPAYLLDAYTKQWTLVANTLKNLPGILGYEFINEPWAGAVEANPELLIPGVADKMNLQPMYDKLSAAIRSVDPNHLIFYESVTWDVLPVGFTAVPGGPQYVNSSVLSHHLYCWFVDNNAKSIRRTLCDSAFEPNWFIMRDYDVKHLGGGSFLTEFGLCNGQTLNSSLECNNVMNLADDFLMSWAYWDYSDGVVYGANGTANLGTVQLISRTYARRTSGMPLAMKFDLNSGAFTFTYRAKGSLAQLPTEIYFNQKLHYPRGVKVRLSSPSMNSTATGNLLHVFHAPEDDNLSLTVSIFPV